MHMECLVMIEPVRAGRGGTNTHQTNKDKDKEQQRRERQRKRERAREEIQRNTAEHATYILLGPFYFSFFVFVFVFVCCVDRSCVCDSW